MAITIEIWHDDQLLAEGMVDSRKSINLDDVKTSDKDKKEKAAAAKGLQNHWMRLN